MINGAALKAVRERSGLTLTGLSGASGIERSLLGKIERGHRRGTPEQARMLAAALKVPTVAILRQPADGEVA